VNTKISPACRKIIKSKSKALVFNARLNIKHCASQIQKSENEYGRHSEKHMENRIEHIKGLAHDLRENNRHVLGFHENCRDHHCKKPQELSLPVYLNVLLCLQLLVNEVNKEYKNRNEKNVQLALKLFSVEINHVSLIEK
jgi:hypothetical protein